MSRLFIFPLTFAVLCLAQDSGLYVNRIKIQTFHNNQGNSKTFTYYVSDSFDQRQVDNFQTAATSIGNLYEDDYASGTSCTNTECPKLKRVYSYVDTTGGKITTRLMLDADIASEQITTAKPIGYVSPYPGYCSSDDKLPIVELYSEELKQYAYWSPADPNQLTNIAATTLDKTRYIPKRVLGYGLTADTERLVLENDAPDYVKPLGRTNYTHTAYPAYEIIQFVSTDGLSSRNQADPEKVDIANTKPDIKFSKSLGVFVLGKETAALNIQLDKVCGSRVPLFAATSNPTGPNHVRIFPKQPATGYKPAGSAGWTFKENRPVCGGIKGLAPLKEFVHKTKTETYTYAVDPAVVSTLTSSGEWTDTGSDLGFAPIDQIGFVLINSAI